MPAPQPFEVPASRPALSRLQGTPIPWRLADSKNPYKFQELLSYILSTRPPIHLSLWTCLSLSAFIRFKLVLNTVGFLWLSFFFF